MKHDGKKTTKTRAIIETTIPQALAKKAVYRTSGSGSKSRGKKSTRSAGEDLDEIDDVAHILAVSNVSSDGRVLPSRPPIVRSRTLPAIVVPGLSILHAQIESSYANKGSGTPERLATAACSTISPQSSKRPESSKAPAVSAVSKDGDVIFSCIPRPAPSSSAVSSSSTNGSPKEPRTPNQESKLGLSRLTKFLNQKANAAEGQSPPSSGTLGITDSLKILDPAFRKESTVTFDLAMDTELRPGRLRRRHSLESTNDLVSLTQKISSIESLLDNSCPPDVTSQTRHVKGVSTRLQLPDLKMSVPLSPSLAKRFGRADKVTPERKKESLESLVRNLNLSKTEMKKMEKLSKINIHVHALFAAVEYGQVEKARSILESTDADVNSVNNDGLTVLDIAVLTHNVEMARTLLTFGAREGVEYGTKDNLVSHLTQLAGEAEKNEEIANMILAAAASGGLSQSQMKEQEKQGKAWRRKACMVKLMRSGFEQMRPPLMPTMASLEVLSESSVIVRFQVSEVESSPICTKFKVQWSTTSEFSLLGGELEVKDLRQSHVIVPNLVSSTRCYCRVAAGNKKGYSGFRPTFPLSVLPAVWRSVEGRKPRFNGRTAALDELFNQVRNARPDHASEIRDLEESNETPAKVRKNQTKISIKHLFASAPKFQKNLRRGIFLACIVYSEDKILVTNEEFPPVIEVDDNYPASINTDFHWLTKVGCTWSDVKTLRQDMEKSLSSSTVHFRIKLLQAASHMQSALSWQDLGQLYYQPLKDSQGTMIMCCVCNMNNTKQVSSINFKWLPVSKLQRRTPYSEDIAAADLLINTIPELISYNQASNVPLAKGLYLGYLKMKSSVDLIRVLVPEKTPNIIPHCKIRDNPCVSSEEWEWVKYLSSQRRLSNDTMEVDATAESESPSKENQESQDDKCEPTAVQLNFQQQLAVSAQQLLNSLGVDEETYLYHRLYDVEVIELNQDVSLLILLPPVESVCAVPGQTECLSQRPGLLLLPLQVFEIVHLRTYQKELIGKYSRLSSILEMDTMLAQHAHREAFSSSEVSDARQRLQKLQDVQSQVDMTWRGARWIMDVLTMARDKTTILGVSLSLLPIHANSRSTVDVIPSFRQPLAPILSDHRSQSVSPSLRSQRSSSKSSSSCSSLYVGQEDAHPLRKRELVKMKSDNKLLKNNSSGIGCDVRFQKANTLDNMLATHSKLPMPMPVNVCHECSVPLDLPGYVTTCSTCSCSRNTAHSEECVRESGLNKTFSRSNDVLSNFSPTSQDNRQGHFSRSEDHLNNLGRETIHFSSLASPNDDELEASLYSHNEVSVGRSTAEMDSAPCCPPASPHSSSSFSELQRYLLTQPAKPRRVRGQEVEPESSGMGLTHPAKLLHRRQGGGSLRSHSQDSEPSACSHAPSLTSLSSLEADPDSLSLLSKGSNSSRGTGQERLGTTPELDTPAETDAAQISTATEEQSGIIQVYAAYETGLATGTSVKLHVTPKTNAREVVDLVVRQLNMAVVLKCKGGPIYGNDELRNFCLVAVIGARERCLRDDFRPLQLQNPWKKGRLFVRQKKDLLAAIEQSSRQPSVL